LVEKQKMRIVNNIDINEFNKVGLLYRIIEKILNKIIKQEDLAIIQNRIIK